MRYKIPTEDGSMLVPGELLSTRTKVEYLVPTLKEAAEGLTENPFTRIGQALDGLVEDASRNYGVAKMNRAVRKGK
jgi:hypothetical protein